MKFDTSATGTLAEYRDGIGIAAERVNVSLDPPVRKKKIKSLKKPLINYF